MGSRSIDDGALGEQIEYYRARAGEYDDFWQRRNDYALPHDVETLWHQDAAETLAFVRRHAVGRHVLELAAGTGIFTEHLLAADRQVHAVDASPEMLAINAERTGGDGVRYEQADLFEWRPDTRYESVVFTFWLSHVPDDRLDEFWAMVGDALVDGGTAVFVGLRSSSAPTSDVPERAYAERRSLRDGRSFDVVKRYWTPETLAADLRDRGWDADVETSTNRLMLRGTARLKSRTSDLRA